MKRHLRCEINFGERYSVKSIPSLSITKIVDFTIQHEKAEWDPDILEALKLQAAQMNLFGDLQEIHEDFRIVEKIPYSFRYIYEDDAGKQHRGMIEDWEIGALYRNCLKQTGNETTALEKVKEMYFGEFLKADIYSFLGTTLRHHYDRNPFIIIGVYHPPYLPEQYSFFDD